MKSKFSCLKLAIAVLVVFAGGAGCAPRLGSDLRIVNGMEVSEETHPAVFWLGNCTGTFVSDNTLLTAAHCIGTSNTVRIKRRTNATSLQVKIHPKTQTTGRLGNYDIAVVVFPDNTAPATIPLKVTRVKAGDQALFVGYGMNSSRGGSGVKRAGRNVVEKVRNATIISSRSTSSPGSGEDVSVAPGDSGGPLFIDGAIAGITSWHSNFSGSGHADLTAEVNRDFLRSTIDSIGARIPMDGPSDNNQIKIALGDPGSGNGAMEVYASVPAGAVDVTFTDLMTGQIYPGSLSGGKFYHVRFEPGVRNSIDLEIRARDATGRQLAYRKIRLKAKN